MDFVAYMIGNFSCFDIYLVCVCKPYQGLSPTTTVLVLINKPFFPRKEGEESGDSFYFILSLTVSLPIASFFL